MNSALTLRPSATPRLGLFLMLGLAFWLASAVSLAPTLVRTAAASSHATVCTCAHCPGGLACCCRQAVKCPTP